MKSITVIDSCSTGLGKMDNAFLRDYQEMRCNDITGNGCYLEVYREHHIWLKEEFYPNIMDGYYLGDDTGIKTKEQVDSLNEMMADFFKCNKIKGDSFLLYVDW